MIARIAHFESLPAVDDATLAAVTAFESSRPGCRGVYQLRRRGSGGALTLSLWDDDASMESLEHMLGEGQYATPDTVYVYDVVQRG